MEQSVKKLDDIIDGLAADTGAPPIRCDPDDPWYSEGFIKSTSVYKIHCTKCGYYYTYPFEKECPICEFTTGKQHEPKFKLDVKAIKAIGKHAQKPKAQSTETAKGKEGASSTAPEKKKKGNPPPKVYTQEELDSYWAHAYFQVARLTNCKKHPDAIKLIVAEAFLGAEGSRVLVTGLIPHYQPEDLEGKLVAVIKNLKPKNMMGIAGGVMLLAATEPASGRIQVLSVPEGSEPGDRIFPENFPLLRHIVDKTMTFEDKSKYLELFQAGSGEEMPEVPKRQFEKIVEGFKIIGEKPTFYGKPLMTARGYLTAPSIPDGAEFH